MRFPCIRTDKERIKNMDFENIKEKLVYATVLVVSMAIYITLIFLLWNWLMPDIFGLPEITLWQTVGVIVLITLSNIFYVIIANSALTLYSKS